MATGAMMGPKKSFKSKVAPGDLSALSHAYVGEVNYFSEN